MIVMMKKIPLTISHKQDFLQVISIPNEGSSIKRVTEKLKTKMVFKHGIDSLLSSFSLDKHQ